MKQIVFLVFTLSGIYTASAQKDVAANVMPDTVKATVAAPVVKPVGTKKDSLFKKTASAKIFTNPVKNKLEIAVNNFEPGTLQLTIQDTRAHILRNDNRMVYSNSELITVMFALPAGVYIVTLKQKDRQVSKKFVVAP